VKFLIFSILIFSIEANMRRVVKVSNRIKAAGEIGISYTPILSLFDICRASCSEGKEVCLHSPHYNLDGIRVLRLLRLAFTTNTLRISWSQKSVSWICLEGLQSMWGGGCRKGVDKEEGVVIHDRN